MQPSPLLRCTCAAASELTSKRQGLQAPQHAYEHHGMLTAKWVATNHSAGSRRFPRSNSTPEIVVVHKKGKEGHLMPQEVWQSARHPVVTHIKFLQRQQQTSMQLQRSSTHSTTSAILRFWFRPGSANLAARMEESHLACMQLAVARPAKGFITAAGSSDISALH